MQLRSRERKKEKDGFDKGNGPCASSRGRFVQKWKQRLRLWLRLILNWRFLICFGLGWIVTNGWSYLLLGLGILFENEWMIGIASAYLAVLWLPISPEKLVTLAIALFLVRRLFPKHKQALEAEIARMSEENESKRG